MSVESKRVVTDWLAAGRPDSGVTTDFTWVLSRTLTERLGREDRVLTGHAGLAELAALERRWFPNDVERTPHFVIAEGDRVVWQGEITATTASGRAYHNYQILTFRLRDGKIAEGFEHTNRARFFEVVGDDLGAA